MQTDLNMSSLILVSLLARVLLAEPLRRFDAGAEGPALPSECEAFQVPLGAGGGVGEWRDLDAAALQGSGGGRAEAEVGGQFSLLYTGN